MEGKKLEEEYNRGGGRKGRRVKAAERERKGGGQTKWPTKRGSQKEKLGNGIEWAWSEGKKNISGKAIEGAEDGRGSW